MPDQEGLMILPMGCGGSTEAKSRVSSSLNMDILDTFLRLDRDIWREEKTAPAPSLGHYIIRLEKLNAGIESTPGAHDISTPPTDEELLPLPARYTESYEEAIQRAVVELQINQNPKNAIEHEEFIANLTRQALRQSRLHWLKQRKQDTEEEISRLNEKVQNLQSLYGQLDALISSVGGTALSDLEVQLDRIRSYRDTLYSGELSWREAARLTHAAATLSKAGRDSWYSLNNTTNIVTRFRVATDCRNAIQEAALCIQTAQTTLSGVMFPYCTMREVSALLQLIEYIYTDLQIPERYSHASEVYNSFQKRATLLSNWIRQMMEDTIRKDVLDVDQKIFELASKLSNERANMIRYKIGLRTNRFEDFGGYMSDKIHMDLERKALDVHTAQNSLWSPRQISERALKNMDNALMWK